MAIVAGTTYHFTDLPPYLTALLQLDKMTPFATMAGQRNGIKTVGDKVYDMSQPWTVDPGAQTGLSEADVVAGANPTRVTRDLEQNGIQLFQHAPQVSFLRQSIANAAAPQLAGAETVNGISDAGVDAATFQIQGHLQKVNKDWDFSALNGVLNVPTNESENFQMGGIIPSIVDNTEDGLGAALSKTMINNLLIKMATVSGSPFQEVTVFCNPTDKVKISALYGLQERDSFEFGGVRVNRLVTDFGEFNIVMDVHVPVGTLLFADMAFCRPVVLPYNGDGILVQQKETDGASSQWQIYLQGGFDFGSELVHGKVINFI